VSNTYVRLIGNGGDLWSRLAAVIPESVELGDRGFAWISPLPGAYQVRVSQMPVGRLFRPAPTVVSVEQVQDRST